MENIELQEIIDACEESESDYIALFRPLLGYEDNVEFHRGIDDSLQDTLEEVEEKIGVEVPGDFLQLYLISNGGKYFDINLYYLTNDKEDKNGLYNRNMNQEFRKENEIPDDAVVIGETDESYILIGIDDDDYYFYCLWNKETKTPEVQFDYLVEALMQEINYYTGAYEVEESEEQ